MLVTVRDRVAGLIAEGKTKEDVVAAKPTADLDEVWGSEGGFMDADRFIGLVYDSLK
jgi:hypothetical protein